jgi:hypothetical protein
LSIFVDVPTEFGKYARKNAGDHEVRDDWGVGLCDLLAEGFEGFEGGVGNYELGLTI